MPSPNTNPKLAAIYSLAFSVPGLTKITHVIIEQEKLEVRSRFLETCTNAGIIPFWVPKCPKEYETQWMDGWEAIRREMSRMATKNPSTYVWATTEMVEVWQWAKRINVAACFDQPIIEELEGRGLGVREIYTLNTNYSRYFDSQTGRSTGFVELSSWDTHLKEILLALLGEDVLDRLDMPLQAARVWWYTTIGPLIKRYSKERDRADENLAVYRRAVMDAVGVEFPEVLSVAPQMTVQRAIDAITNLGMFKFNLSWQSSSSKDLDVCSRRVPDPSSVGWPENAQKRWRQLTVNARAMNFPPLIAGYLAGIIGRRVQKEFKDIKADFDSPHRDRIFELGRDLTLCCPPEEIDQIPEPTPEELDQFEAELFDFAFAWHETRETMTSCCSVVKNVDLIGTWADYIGDTSDIGVEAWRQTSMRNLYTYLGCSNKLPPFLRHFTSPNDSNPPGDGMRPFDGSVPTSLLWHQLVYVAAALEKLNGATGAKRNELPDPAEVDPKLYWITEDWGSVPGVALFDEVGLGKTFCTTALISTLQNWFARQDIEDQYAPFMQGKTIGPRTKLPNDPHLIIVPKNLASLWVAHLRRYFQAHQVQIFEYSTEALKWESDMETIRNAQQPAWRCIIVVTHCALQHSFVANRTRIENKKVENYPRLHVAQPYETLFSLRFCSAHVDEAHDTRTRAPLWDAVSAIMELTLVKCVLTATPLIEHPNDLVKMALLLRPSSMGWATQVELAAMASDLAKARTKDWRITQQASLALNDAHTLVSTSLGPGAGELAGEMIRTVQKHLLPLTIRRSRFSVDWEGKKILPDMPPYTEVLVNIEVTADQSDMLKGTGDETERLYTTAITGPFFSEARLYFSFPDKIPENLSTYDLPTFNSGGAIKAKCLVAICRALFTIGPTEFIPPQYQERTDTILTPEELGLGDLIRGFVATRLLPSERRHAFKIVVFTYFTKFHAILKRILELCGFNVVVISGSLSTKQRDARIERFKNDPSVDILLMSPIGQTGLNLTEACVIILYDVFWSLIISDQAKGRLYRRGQMHPVLALQLMCRHTVESLLTVNGLIKHNMLQKFLEDIDVARILQRMTPGDLDDEDVHDQEDAAPDFASPQSPFGMELARRARGPEDDDDVDALVRRPRKTRKMGHPQDSNPTSGKRARPKRIGALADGPSDTTALATFRDTLNSHYPSLTSLYDDYTGEDASTSPAPQADFLAIAATLFPAVFEIPSAMEMESHGAEAEELVDHHRRPSNNPDPVYDHQDMLQPSTPFRSPSPDVKDPQAPSDQDVGQPPSEVPGFDVAEEDFNIPSRSPRNEGNADANTEYEAYMARIVELMVTHQLGNPNELVDTQELVDMSLVDMLLPVDISSHSVPPQPMPALALPPSAFSAPQSGHNAPSSSNRTVTEMLDLAHAQNTDDNVPKITLDSRIEPTDQDMAPANPVELSDWNTYIQFDPPELPSGDDFHTEYPTAEVDTNVAVNYPPHEVPPRHADGMAEISLSLPINPNHAPSLPDANVSDSSLSLPIDAIHAPSLPDADRFTQFIATSSRLSPHPDTSFSHHRPNPTAAGSLSSFRPQRMPNNISTAPRRSPGSRIAPSPADPPMMLPTATNTRKREPRQRK